MAKCPYCDVELHLESFYEILEKEKKGKIKIKMGNFKGEESTKGPTTIRMWACPTCDKILGFSEYYWSKI